MCSSPIKSLLWIVFVCFYITGCADNLSGDTYSRDEARRTMAVQYGTVDAVRPVVIQGERGFLGNVGGAVVGGVAGNAVGNGSGRAIATAVGAVAGSVLGSATQERATRAQGAEITVRLDNGSGIAVVQEVENLNEFVPGQRVRLTQANGTTRVAPLVNNYAPQRY
jgi:outer membrane lipoprotein SlyB